MSQPGRPKSDLSIRKNLSKNISTFRERLNLSYIGLKSELQREGINVSEATIRSWERSPDKSSASIPSLPSLIALRDVLGVGSVDRLLLGNRERNRRALYEVIRPPFDAAEEQLVLLLRKVTDGLPYPENDARRTNDRQTNRLLFRQLLFSKLIRVNAQNIRRVSTLEARLKAQRGYLKDVRVLDLPGKDCPGVRDFFFAAASAAYLEEIVTGGVSRIGLASGRTVAGMVELIRMGSLQNTFFFPILPVGGAFSATTITSTAIVANLVFRHEAYGVQMPENVDEPDFFKTYLQTADALFFSLGNHQYSSLIKILQYCGLQREELTFFVGDLLFNLLTKTGQTFDEILDLTEMAKRSDAERAEIEEVAGLRQRKRELNSLHLDLDLVSKHAQCQGVRTVALACGVEKLGIVQAMFARADREGKPTCNVLIADKGLAEGLVQ